MCRETLRDFYGTFCFCLEQEYFKLLTPPSVSVSPIIHSRHSPPLCLDSRILVLWSDRTRLNDLQSDQPLETLSIQETVNDGFQISLRHDLSGTVCWSETGICTLSDGHFTWRLRRDGQVDRLAKQSRRRRGCHERKFVCITWRKTKVLKKKKNDVRRENTDRFHFGIRAPEFSERYRRDLELLVKKRFIKIIGPTCERQSQW